MSNPTQKDMFYAASRDISETYQDFMFMVNCKENPMTRQDLERLIAKRPNVYGKYAGFLDKLPNR